MLDLDEHNGPKALRIVVIGAGLAGLATAYGLQHTPGVNIRILEKRLEHQGQDQGYPIHLSKSGRDSLHRLLSPQDILKLYQNRNELPGCHDGITIIQSSTSPRKQGKFFGMLDRAIGGEGAKKGNGNVLWRMVDSPGEKCLMERERLIDILKGGLQPHPASSGSKKGQRRKLSDDEKEMAKQEGGEGKTSGESLKSEGESNDVQTHNPGVFIEYGMTVVSIEKETQGWKIILSTGEVITSDLLIGADGMFSKVRQSLHSQETNRRNLEEEGIEALPWTTINIRTTSTAVRSWVKDQVGMNMIFGKGWSAAFMALSRHDKSAFVRKADLSQSFQVNTTGWTGCYVALTIPHPSSSIRDAITAFPESRDSNSFLSDLLADPGLDKARAFPLWTSKKTILGRRRAILIGDASHGMVPYCGAGASSGLKDANDIVDLVHNHLFFEGNLDYLLERFQIEQKKFNDPLIAQSRKVLWIVQGETKAKRFCRSIAFAALELVEKLASQRKHAEEDLRMWKGIRSDVYK